MPFLGDDFSTGKARMLESELMRCFVRCFMLGGSGTTTFQGGHVLFMSRRKCLLEFINIQTNQIITCLASDSDSSLIFRFVLSFTKSITELSFPVSFLSFLLVENGNLLLVVNIGNKKNMVTQPSSVARLNCFRTLHCRNPCCCAQPQPIGCLENHARRAGLG